MPEPRNHLGAGASRIGGGQQDIVDFAVALQARIDELNASVAALGTRVEAVNTRLDGSVSKTAIVRYDAYENSGGHQSASVALLDASRTGVVLSAIQGRDYARIYIKELDRGREWRGVLRSAAGRGTAEHGDPWPHPFAAID